MGFPRRQTGTRGVDWWLMANKANGVSSPPRAHTALTAPREGQKGPWALDLPQDAVCLLEPSTDSGAWPSKVRSLCLQWPPTRSLHSPLPALWRGYGFMETLTGTPWLSRAGPTAPRPASTLSLSWALFLLGSSLGGGGVCPSIRHEWEESCISNWPRTVPAPGAGSQKTGTGGILQASHCPPPPGLGFLGPLDSPSLTGWW